MQEGTSFHVYLPVAETLPPKPSSLDVLPAARGEETILLVEDSDMVRTMITIILQKHGYNVLETSNGSEAVAVAENHRGPIHLVITDLVMPKLSGSEIADRLTAIRPGLRVLFMSGVIDDAVIRQGGESSQLDFLRKPFNIAALTQTVRGILDRE